MNKRIIIGSVLVLTLLLLMPSIPAVQKNVVKDETLNEISEDFNLEELTKSGRLDKEKHPILLVIVSFWIFFRLIRMDKLWDISSNWDPYGDNEIHNPIIFLRAIWLYLSVEFVSIPLDAIANMLSWNWEPISDYVSILIDKYY